MLAARHRKRHNPILRFVPALLLAAAIVRVPQPSYLATETTLSNAFAGERVAFTGVVQRDAGMTAVVRYAITCCRAVAAPVSVVLDRAAPPRHWVRVSGTLERGPPGLRLRVERLESIAVPDDPFVYR